MDKIAKQKPEQILFVGFGRRNPSFNVLKWKGRDGRPDSVVFQVSDPMIKGSNGYPERISFNGEQIKKIFDALTEKELL